MATASVSDKKLSDEIYDFVCTPCKGKNKRRKAEKYCPECESQLCSLCLNHHNAVHDDHELFAPCDADDSQVGIAAFERCGKHPKFIIEGFCVSCNELLCHTCAFKHRGCGSNVVSIPKKIKDLYKDADMKKIVTQLQGIVTKLKSGTSGITRCRDSVRKCKKDTVGIVRTHFEKLANDLKDIEVGTIKEVEAICAGIENEMQTGTKESKNIEADVKECLGKLSEGSSATEAQMFIKMKKGETLVSSADQVLQKTDKLIRRTLGTYYLDGRIERYLRRISTVGCFKPMYSVKNAFRYTFRMSRERICDIRYSCLLPDGRVLLSDYGNKQLICFSPSSNTVTENWSMPHTPFGVCCVSTQEVAIALGNQTVQFVMFTPSLKLSKSFNVNHKCLGIAYNGECLFITDYCSKVYVHTLDGSLVQVITVPGVPFACDVALSPGGELLYVTGDTGLTCLETCGRSVYTLGAEGGCCRGMGVDKNGCVVVCDSESGNVVQVGENGNVLAKLLCGSNGVKNPWSVCVDGSNMKLYVTARSIDEFYVADIVAE